MHIGELEKPPKKKRKRIGRGPGSGHGKTSGKGHKGQRARAGSKKRPSFEGGQMPLSRRIPKRGFRPLNKKVFQLVNVLSLQKFDDGQTIDPGVLQQKGLIKYSDRPVKILGNGDLTKKLKVYADVFSQTARDKIAQAGGEALERLKVEIIKQIG